MNSSTEIQASHNHRHDGWLETYFSLTERKSSVMQELRAALATFLTMSYILLVNPQVLAKVGLSAREVVVSTALSSFVGSAFAGLFGNMPVGLAPGIGLSAYLTYGLVLGQGLSIHEAFTSVRHFIHALMNITGW